MSRLPDFIIIGSMKSATSTLHDQLAEQPGFFMSVPKEPCFFSDDPVYARGADWYRSLFAKAPADALCGESSTHYTKLPTYPETAGRMAALLPDAKLVYMMRHPIERLISHYIHAWTENEIRVPIDQAIQQHPELVSYSEYARQLEPFLEAFGTHAILPLFFERFRQHGPTELERVARFLGHTGPTRWVDAQTRKNVSADRLRKSPLRDRVVQAPGLAWLRRTLIPQSVRDQVKALWQMRERPELSPQSLCELRARFDADLEQLGKWLGVPISCDSFVETVRSTPLAWGETR